MRFYKSISSCFLKTTSVRLPMKLINCYVKCTNSIPNQKLAESIIFHDNLINNGGKKSLHNALTFVANGPA